MIIQIDFAETIRILVAACIGLALLGAVLVAISFILSDDEV